MRTKLFTLSITVTLMTFSLSSEAMGQSSPPTVYLSSTNDYFLKNKLSNKLLDVRDGSKTPGAQIWQHDLNYSVAQRFRVILWSRYGNDAYVIRPRTSQDLYVSLRHSLSSNVASGFASGVVVGELPTTVLGNPVIDASGIDPNIFKVVQERGYEIRPIVTAASPISSQPRYQIWKFVPVPNEPNTYFLESAAFTERMVLQPTSVTSGSPLRLSKFNGSEIQKWLVLPTTPERPLALELRNFVWRERRIVFITRGKVKGGLEWIDNSSNEDGFDIQMKRKDDNGFFSRYWSLGHASANSITFNFSHSGSKGRGKEHCFTVIAYNAWGGSSSNEACGIPVEAPTPPPPPPPPPSGVESIAVYNCHNEKKTVRIWTYDHTTNSGQWEDRGTIASDWDGSGCPRTNVLQFSITPGHTYSIKGIDCGDDPPNLADGGCHRLQEAPLILGKLGGLIQLLIVN